jgi:hypothetical protein
MNNIATELVGEEIVRNIEIKDRAQLTLKTTQKRLFSWWVYILGVLLGFGWGTSYTVWAGKNTLWITASVASISFFLIISLISEVMSLRKRVDALVVLSSFHK